MFNKFKYLTAKKCSRTVYNGLLNAVASAVKAAFLLAVLLCGCSSGPVDNPNAEEYRLKSDFGPDVVFWGELVAQSTDKTQLAAQVQISLYRTLGDNWVAYKTSARRSYGTGSWVSNRSAYVFKTDTELLNWLVYVGADEYLYKAAGIDSARIVP